MPLDNPPIISFDLTTVGATTPLVAPGGRLSLSATDILGSGANVTTFYYLPSLHALLPVWDEGVWRHFRIPDSGIVVNAGAQNPNNYDVYANANAGVQAGFSLDLQGWSSANARLWPVVRKDGILCIRFNQNAPYEYRTYLGSLRFTGANNAATMNDSPAQRFVFNAYNQIERRVMRADPAASWVYGTNTWRNANNSSANRIEVLDGLAIGQLDVTMSCRVITPAGQYAECGMGWNTTPSPTDGYTTFAPGDVVASHRAVRAIGAIGAHYVQLVEKVSPGGANATFTGTYLGLQGLWRC